MHRINTMRTFSALLSAVAVIGLFSASVPAASATTWTQQCTQANVTVPGPGGVYQGDFPLNCNIDRGTNTHWRVGFSCASTSGGSIRWTIWQVKSDGSNATTGWDENNTGTSCLSGETYYDHTFDNANAQRIKIVIHASPNYSDWSGYFKWFYAP